MRALALVFLLSACGSTPDASLADPNGWAIGAPSITPFAGNTFTIPAAPGRVNYVTRATGPLMGTIHLKFHLDAPLTGADCGTGSSFVALYFQRKGDGWGMDGKPTDGKRWWATFAPSGNLDHAGDYELTAPLDGPWTSVIAMTAVANPAEFALSKAEASRVGFTFGNCTGWGHGASGPATVTILDWSVQ